MYLSSFCFLTSHQVRVPPSKIEGRSSIHQHIFKREARKLVWFHSWEVGVDCAARQLFHLQLPRPAHRSLWIPFGVCEELEEAWTRCKAADRLFLHIRFKIRRQLLFRSIRQQCTFSLLLMWPCSHLLEFDRRVVISHLSSTHLSNLRPSTRFLISEWSLDSFFSSDIQSSTRVGIISARLWIGA